MIDNIGLSRVITIIFFLVLNASLVGGAYFLIEPEIAKQKASYSSVKSDLTYKYQEVITLREDFVLLKGRLKEFTSLQLAGFFDNQNKIAATAKGNEFAIRAGITGELLVASAEEVSDPKASSVDHVLLKSPINIEVEAEDDADIMYFLKLMGDRFPGVLLYKSIDLKRVKNIDGPTLRQIGNDINTPLVEANIEIDWYTMPSKESLNDF